METSVAVVLLVVAVIALIVNGYFLLTKGGVPSWEEVVAAVAGADDADDADGD